MTRLPHTHEADGLECLFGESPGLPLLTNVIDEYVLKLEYQTAMREVRKPNPINQTDEE